MSIDSGEKIDMSDILKKFENLKFRQKLVMIFGIALILSLILSLCSLTVFCIRIYKKNYIRNSELLTSQIADTFERKLSDTEKQLFNTINMFQIPDYMRKLEDEPGSYTRQDLRYMTNQLVSSASIFDFVYVETQKGFAVDTSQKLSSGGDEAVDFAGGILDNNKEELKKKGYLWATDEHNQVFLFHCVRRLGTLEHTGYVAARVKQEAIGTLQKDAQDNSLSVLFYNRNQSCIYMDKVPDEIQKDILRHLNKGQEIEGNHRLKNRTFYAIKISNQEWNTIGIVSMDDVNTIRNSMIFIGFLVGFAAIAIGSALVSYLTRKISIQLEALTESMYEMAHGSIGTITPVYSHDDIGELTICFNNMSQRIVGLMEKNIAEERLKNQAELEALDYRYRFLQGQINPHFIYNALETVNAIAKIHKNTEISSVVQLIAKYFRNTTTYSNHQFISLEAEFDSLKTYVDIYHDIQKNNLVAELNYPRELAYVKIPGMILQPIVENCFMHGTRSAEELLVVRLNATRNEDMLRITIEDNGRGISRQQMKEEIPSSGEKDRHSGIGLTNIKERLQLLYGEKGSLKIESSQFGTTVTVEFPIKM